MNRILTENTAIANEPSARERWTRASGPRRSALAHGKRRPKTGVYRRTASFRLGLVLYAGTIAPTLLAADAPAPPPAGELAVYEAVGFSVAEDLRLRQLHWTPEQFEAFVTGLRASYTGASLSADEKTFAGVAEIARQINALKTGQATTAAPAPAAAAPAQAELEQFMQQMRREFGLQQADSGLLFSIAKAGSGPRPTKNDIVTVSFEVASPDAPNGLPQLAKKNARLKVADLMPGLAEGVQMLALDGAALLLLPPSLSFDRGTWPQGVAPGTPLMFRLQLHDIEAADAVP